MRIKKSIERIRANNADLGRHLAAFVHTGNFCLSLLKSPSELEFERVRESASN
jgi:hypothetical protein